MAQMIEISISTLVMLGITTAAGAIAYLLRKKDEAQEHSIHLLFRKHDEDAARLDALKLEIAQKHYVKEEMDARFNKLEQAFTKGFDTLGAKFDKLSDALMDHIRREDERTPK